MKYAMCRIPYETASRMGLRNLCIKMLQTDGNVHPDVKTCEDHLFNDESVLVWRIQLISNHKIPG